MTKTKLSECPKCKAHIEYQEEWNKSKTIKTLTCPACGNIRKLHYDILADIFPGPKK